MPPDLLVTQSFLAGELEAIRSEIYKLRGDHKHELKKAGAELGDVLKTLRDVLTLLEEIVADNRDRAEHPNRIAYDLLNMKADALAGLAEAIKKEQRHRWDHGGPAREATTLAAAIAAKPRPRGQRPIPPEGRQ